MCGASGGNASASAAPSSTVNSPSLWRGGIIEVRKASAHTSARAFSSARSLGLRGAESAVAAIKLALRFCFGSFFRSVESGAGLRRHHAGRCRSIDNRNKWRRRRRGGPVLHIREEHQVRRSAERLFVGRDARAKRRSAKRLTQSFCRALALPAATGGARASARRPLAAYRVRRFTKHFFVGRAARAKNAL
jgi:hypothetical protein